MASNCPVAFNALDRAFNAPTFVFIEVMNFTFQIIPILETTQESFLMRHEKNDFGIIFALGIAGKNVLPPNILYYWINCSNRL